MGSGGQDATRVKMPAATAVVKRAAGIPSGGMGALVGRAPGSEQSPPGAAPFRVLERAIRGPASSRDSERASAPSPRLCPPPPPSPPSTPSPSTKSTAPLAPPHPPSPAAAAARFCAGPARPSPAVHARPSPSSACDPGPWLIPELGVSERPGATKWLHPPSAAGLGRSERRLRASGRRDSDAPCGGPARALWRSETASDRRCCPRDVLLDVCPFLTNGVEFPEQSIGRVLTLVRRQPLQATIQVHMLPAAAATRSVAVSGLHTGGPRQHTHPSGHLLSGRGPARLPGRRPATECIRGSQPAEIRGGFLAKSSEIAWRAS
jgi:hypothetical protein